ncbi:MAG: hypothetical protein R3A10_07290 [Caldilineaceae bacterium]
MEQLFDLETDPDTLHNVIEDDVYAGRGSPARLADRASPAL